jgi:hypothetical protein
MKRSKFIKISALGIATSMSGPKILLSNFMANTDSKNQLFYSLLENNDKRVKDYLSRLSDKTRIGSSRSMASEFAVICASYGVEESKHYQSEAALNRLEEICSELIELQYPNGTLDSGGNRQSPPDTAFLIEHLGPAATILSQVDSSPADALKNKLSGFLKNVGEGLITGGVHTPNHRWVVSAALARLYNLYKDERYLKRMDEWLAEGVYLDDDGQFPERSRNYAVVEGRSLMIIGHLLNRPELFEPVKKNLISTFYFMEENGELITLDSRRQDQNYVISVSRYYLLYRYFAIYFQDELFAAIVKKIEANPHLKRGILSTSLIDFLYVPVLFEDLPEKTSLPTNYTKEFLLTNLVRIKRNNKTATIFGGNDRPIQIASGRSTNPSFFTFRKGKAILEYARLSTSFFRTGYFRSQGIAKNGSAFTLHETKEAYYYQPLSVGDRNPEGDYQLSQSPDGRFWSKMDFESRKKSNIQVLETNVTIHERDGGFEMEIDVSGPKQVEVVLELCFRKGGKLDHVVSSRSDEDYFLQEGFGTYQVANDTIRFGPGKADHTQIRRIDGELYSTHFGSIKGKGNHVYLTGYTPFKHTITIG